MRRTKQQWLEVFQVQRDSNLSIRDFCLEQGISASSFYKYRAIIKIPSEATLPSPFSQVTLIEPKPVVTPNAISLNVGNVNMTFNGHTDARWLASLVGQLV